MAHGSSHQKALSLGFAAALVLVAMLWAGARPALALSEKVRLVSVEQIVASLPESPMAVGFDVDGTLLFTSPGFFYGANNIDGPNGTNKFGTDCYKNKLFWQEMNSRLDQYSLPKHKPVELLKKHFARGDSIYVITARPASKGEKLTAWIERLFKVKLAAPVIFTGRSDKSAAIKKHGIRLFYGDGDNDMSSAIKAGARPIRIIRAENSTAPDPQHPGRFGEEVVADSGR